MEYKTTCRTHLPHVVYFTAEVMLLMLGCRLLFHHVRPVFVFDGAAPALKRSTHIARRQRREEQNSALRRTAEKLLLNQIKAHAVMQVGRQPSGNMCNLFKY